MWLFCKSGFFSAVQHANKPDKILLRARFKGDLENLCDIHLIECQHTIRHTPSCDYAWRMELPKALWAKIVLQEAQIIDYQNFKNEIHKYGNRNRDNAYNQVWSALAMAQDVEERRDDHDAPRLKT